MLVSSLRDVAGLDEVSSDVSTETMWKTYLHSSWKNLSTSLGQQSAQVLCCTGFFCNVWLTVVFDHWPRMNIRALRTAGPTTGLKTCSRGFAPSRRAQGRERRRFVMCLHFTISCDSRCRVSGFPDSLQFHCVQSFHAQHVH